MNAALAQACSVFFCVIAPGTLIVRYFWPRILPRWGVLACAGSLGGTAFYLRELLYRADMMEFAQSFSDFEQTVPIVVDGMVRLQMVRTIDFFLGAVLELIYLLLWLVPYGIIQILRNRRRQAIQVAA
jgi:hypothetical protein